MTVPSIKQVASSPLATIEADYIVHHLLWVLFSGAAIGGCGLWMLSSLLNAPSDVLPTPFIWIASFVVMVGIAMMAVALRRLMAPHPLLRISPAGILDRNIAPETIPWSAITDIYVSDRIGVHLMIRLAPNHAISAKTRRSEQALAGVGRKIGAPGFAVTVRGLDRPFEDILATIEEHAPVNRAPTET